MTRAAGKRTPAKAEGGCATGQQAQVNRRENPREPGVSVPGSPGLSYACKPLQRLHGLRNRNWSPRAALSAYSREETSRRLVRESSPKTSWSMAGVHSGSSISLEQYRVVQHGVAIYFGSANKLNHEHLKKLKRLVKRTNTPWLSDHLCWGKRGWTLHSRSARCPYTLLPRGDCAENPGNADFLEVPICVETTSAAMRSFTLRDDRVGIPQRSRRSSPIAESSLMLTTSMSRRRTTISILKLFKQHPPSSRGSDSYRRPFEVREVILDTLIILCSTPCGVCARTQ